MTTIQTEYTQVTVPADPNECATKLKDQGYVVIPLLPEESVAQCCADFMEAVRSFPEYNDDLGRFPQFSKTGFGALATASSFHNIFVRKMRQLLHSALVKTLEKYEIQVSGGDKKRMRLVHSIMDRMLVRVPGQGPSAETLHRDKSIDTVGGDTVFGGWISFTDNQFISLVPGTHTMAHAGQGFAPIEPGSALYEQFMRDRVRVAVPKGSVVLFNQDIVHEVLSAKVPKDQLMLRLFTGFRLTHDTEDLLAKQMRNSNSRQDGKGDAQHLATILEDQAVPKIPSNQLPSLFNVRSVDTPAQQAALNEWITKYIRPELLEEIHPDSFHKGKRNPDGTPKPKYPYALPPLHMPSLKELGRKYPPYTMEEAFILKPHSFYHV